MKFYNRIERRIDTVMFASEEDIEQYNGVFKGTEIKRLNSGNISIDLQKDNEDKPKRYVILEKDGKYCLSNEKHSEIMSLENFIHRYCGVPDAKFEKMYLEFEKTFGIEHIERGEYLAETFPEESKTDWNQLSLDLVKIGFKEMTRLDLSDYSKRKKYASLLVASANCVIYEMKDQEARRKGCALDSEALDWRTRQPKLESVEELNNESFAKMEEACLEDFEKSTAMTGMIAGRTDLGITKN